MNAPCRAGNSKVDCRKLYRRLHVFEMPFCHHSRSGLGQECHAAIEKDWRTPAGQTLVKNWIKQIMKDGAYSGWQE